jgi:prevent-host-death family protein
VLGAELARMTQSSILVTISSMRRRHSIAEARTNLPRLIREAESGKVVELTRRGNGVAVLIGQREYERLISRSRRFSEAWSEFTAEIDLAQLEIDPDEVFAGVRDQSPGRNSGL